MSLWTWLNATRSERWPDDRIYTHPGLNKETGQSSAISGIQYNLYTHAFTLDGIIMRLACSCPVLHIQEAGFLMVQLKHHNVGSLKKPRNCTFFKKSFFHMARLKTFKFSLWQSLVGYVQWEVTFSMTLQNLVTTNGKRTWKPRICNFKKFKYKKIFIF